MAGGSQTYLVTRPQAQTLYLSSFRHTSHWCVLSRASWAATRKTDVGFGQPFFLLLTFGYKLIKQTEMIPLDKMQFDRGEIPPLGPDKREPDGWLDWLLIKLRIIG